MSVAAEAPGILIDDRLSRRNALVLAVCQALAGGNAAVLFATSAIVGYSLAPDKSLATLPITAYVFGLWAGSLPVGYMSYHLGRRAAFQVGTVFGVITGLVNALAIYESSFWLLLLGNAFGGLYAANTQAYRFAAADTASPAFKPKAISWVLAGGLFAAFTGSQLSIHTRDLLAPYLFLATYFGQSVVAILAGCVLTLLRIPKLEAPSPAVQTATRPIREIARQPKFLTAVVCGVASYTLMNLIMTSSPLAMVDCGHSFADATLGQQWHIIAMYAPSFFTGSLIARFGSHRITALGLLLYVVAAVVALAGTSLWHFWIALTVLGVAWNFGYVGATTMVTDTHRPYERNKVQAFNDFLVFGTMGVGTFVSGQMYVKLGWNALNALMFPVIFIGLAMLTWYLLSGRHRAA